MSSQKNQLNDHLKAGEISLRPLNIDDLHFYQVLYADQRLMTFIGEVQEAKTAEKYFNLTLKYMLKKPPFMILYVICEKLSQQPIGVVGLRWNQKQADSVEIGVIIEYHHHRKGYAHMAKTRLIKHAFESLGVCTIVAHCDEANVAANAANQKLGFTYHNMYIDEDRHCPVIEWKMTKQVFQS